MDDLDHSGFVVNKHHMESEILESKIAMGIMKSILADFKKRSVSWKNKNKSQATLCLRSSGSSAQKKPGRYDEGARLAQCGVAQRQPQDVQSDLERNFDGSGE